MHASLALWLKHRSANSHNLGPRELISHQVGHSLSHIMCLFMCKINLCITAVHGMLLRHGKLPVGRGFEPCSGATEPLACLFERIKKKVSIETSSNYTNTKIVSSEKCWQRDQGITGQCFWTDVLLLFSGKTHNQIIYSNGGTQVLSAKCTSRFQSKLLHG